MARERASLGFYWRRLFQEDERDDPGYDRECRRDGAREEVRVLCQKLGFSEELRKAVDRMCERAAEDGSYGRASGPGDWHKGICLR